jgi:hypothetical protein
MTLVINDSGVLAPADAVVGPFMPFVHNGNGQWSCNVSTTWFSERTRVEGSIVLNGPSLALAANSLQGTWRGSNAFPNTNQLFHNPNISPFNIGYGVDTRGVFDFEIMPDGMGGSVLYMDAAGPNLFYSMTARFIGNNITFQNIANEVRAGSVVIKAWRS